MPLCSTCQTKEARKKQRTCKDCHGAYMKKWRAGARVLRGTLPRGTVARVAKAQERLQRAEKVLGGAP